MKIDRVYHPYYAWEETYTRMWSKVKDREAFLRVAIDFTGDAERYGQFMRIVTEVWPVSCEHNLTNKEQNRKAWIGHAACAFAFGCPEDVVRQAWGFLSKEQQDAANLQAEQAIDAWEEKYLEGKCQNED